MRYTREQACLAWLAQGMLGSRRLKKLLDEYGSAEAAYDAFQRDHGASLQNRISDYSLSLLRASASREKLHDMLVTMRKWNMGLVSMADDMYPESLRNIPEPPYMLFYQGDLRAAEGRCITVIGSRSATVAGIAATKSLCRDLSKQGVCIVSGLAVGIDAAAHDGCLDGGSPTIGVAASGLNVPYPSENVALKARILSQGGLLLSEYPPDMQSSKYVFAVRNRILHVLDRDRLAVDEVDDTDYISDLYIIIIVHIRLGKTEVGDHVILVPQDVAYGSGHVLYVYQHVEVRIAIAGVNPRIVLNRPAGE